MGTRNTMKIYLNDELMLNQYGQWDGYPTGQGLHILEVLKNGDKLDYIIQNVQRGRIRMISIDEAGELEKILKTLPDYMGENLCDMFFRIAPMSRDYGAGGILDYLSQRYWGGNVFFLNCDFGDQEGNYVLRLFTEDRNDRTSRVVDYSLDMEFHGITRHYSCKDILDMVSPSDEMKAFEDEVREQDEKDDEIFIAALKSTDKTD